MINNTLADALFGASNSYNAGSFFSASNFGDLAMIKSGVYTKLMRSYVSKLDDSGSKDSKQYLNLVNEKISKLSETPSTTATDEAKKVLSDIKSAAKTLEGTANDLAKMDFDDSTREELYDAAKKFADSYNTLVKDVAGTDNVSLTKSVDWMKGDLKAREKMFAKIGVSFGADGKMSIDEEKFNAANLRDIKSLFQGSGSIVGKTAQRATGIYNLAANQISASSGSSFYSSNGTLG